MTKAEIEKRLAELEEEYNEAHTERNMWEQRMYKIEREKNELEEMLDDLQ